MSWHALAACRDTPGSHDIPDHDLSHVQRHARIRAALLMCRHCPVSLECGQDAAEYGDWGVIRAGRLLRSPPAWRPQFGGRRLAPCGTAAAYRRHLRHNEPADEACLAAHTAEQEARRRLAS